ncbi:MAG: hypothetical protein KBD47_02720 [Candidatus Pacebacteria bacterium]|jgi:uncharacterized protein YxeA|nr:hypothetical protein [Candidatus Paceibacterota bacterium]
MKKIFITSLILLATSGVAFAQNADFGPANYYPGSVNPFSTTNSSVSAGSKSGGVTDLKSLVDFIIDYINEGIYLLMALATIAFVYNIIQYYVVKKDADRTEAASYLLYSIIGLAVIVSFWGLVNVVLATFSLKNTQPDVKNIYFKR